MTPPSIVNYQTSTEKIDAVLTGPSLRNGKRGEDYGRPRRVFAPHIALFLSSVSALNPIPLKPAPTKACFSYYWPLTDSHRLSWTISSSYPSDWFVIDSLLVNLCNCSFHAREYLP